MKPKIEIDNQDIIDSGSLIVDKSKQIRFNFEESNLNFKFNFIEDKENALSVGCDSYVAKPISIKVLVEAIEKAMS